MLKLNRHFRNDAQGPLGSGKKLFQGQSRRAFLQTRACRQDIPRRRHHFDRIDLVACRTVFDRFIPAGIVGHVPANHAVFRAGRIAGVQQAVGPSRFLQVVRGNAGLGDAVEGVTVHFEDLVHALHFHDHAVIDRNGAAGDIRAGRAGRNGHKEFVGQLDDGRHFFRRTRKHDHFRFAEVVGIAFLVGLVLNQSLFVATDVFVPDDNFQFGDDFRCHRMIMGCHDASSLSTTKNYPAVRAGFIIFCIVSHFLYIEKMSWPSFPGHLQGNGRGQKQPMPVPFILIRLPYIP